MWRADSSSFPIPIARLLMISKGDTNLADLPVVKDSDIIITTPEKWDSISRRWRDSRKLVEMIRLFLIDEVSC